MSLGSWESVLPRERYGVKAYGGTVHQINIVVRKTKTSTVSSTVKMFLEFYELNTKTLLV